jgi:hypothetical protein
MAELKLKNKSDYAQAVCLFLAEGLRTRKITLKRAADISQKVATHLNLLDTERDFLKLVKELAIDFEELIRLEQRVHVYIQSDDRTRMEHKVKEFAISIMPQDTESALAIMESASKDGVSIDMLASKFPKFKEFIQKK